MVRSPSLPLLRVGVVVALALAACSGSYFAASQDAGAPPDASPSPPDVATSPPPSDAAPNDAGSPGDAAADAPVDTGPPSPCSRASLFCDDFDDLASPLGAKWTSTNNAAGPIDLDTTLPVTRPRAFRVQLVPGGGDRSSTLTKNLDIPGDVRISLDARVDFPSTGTFNEIDPLIIGVGPPSAGTAYQLFAFCIYSSTVQFEAYRAFVDGGQAVSSEVIAASDGVYHHVTVTLRSAGGTTNATLAIDGTNLTTRSLATETPRNITLQVGAPYTNNANTTATIRVDNVIVERL